MLSELQLNIPNFENILDAFENKNYIGQLRNWRREIKKFTIQTKCCS